MRLKAFEGGQTTMLICCSHGVPQSRTHACRSCCSREAVRAGLVFVGFGRKVSPGSGFIQPKLAAFLIADCRPACSLDCDSSAEIKLPPSEALKANI